MPTLNKLINYPDSRLKLKYHKSRKPDSALMDKIGESLGLAYDDKRRCKPLIKDQKECFWVIPQDTQ